MFLYILLNNSRSINLTLRHVHINFLNRYFSRKSDIIKEEEPIKFSTSEAKHYNSIDTFVNTNVRPPWYQPASVLISVSCFLIYFLVLREENDWDEDLSKPLYNKIPGLKENDLNARIQRADMLGADSRVLKAEYNQLITENKNKKDLKQ